MHSDMVWRRLGTGLAARDANSRSNNILNMRLTLKTKRAASARPLIRTLPGMLFLLYWQDKKVEM